MQGKREPQSTSVRFEGVSLDPNPILLVGTQRSGTTWLYKMFSQHPKVASANEPRHIWIRGNAYRPDDRLTEADATPRTIARIHRAFSKIQAQQGKPRLMEKTPSNCLRVPFLRAVFPQAKILLVLRDGRSVVRSTADVQQRKGKLHIAFHRAANTPVHEWPAQAGRAADVFRRRVLGKPLPIWGPRPPGWREWVGNDHPDVVRAKQWSATILTAFRDVNAMIERAKARGEEPNVLIFRYEDIVAEPGPTMSRILEFAGLPDDGIVERLVGTVDQERFAKRQGANSDEQLERMRPHMEPALVELGYTW